MGQASPPPSTTISPPPLPLHIRRKGAGSMACRDAIRAEAARQLQVQKQSVGGEITQGNYLGPASYRQGNL